MKISHALYRVVTIALILSFATPVVAAAQAGLDYGPPATPVQIIGGDPLPQAEPSPNTRPGKPVQVVKSDEQSVIVEFTASGYRISTTAAGGQTYHKIETTAYALDGSEGEPQLPVLGVLIAIPPDANVSLRIAESEVEQIPGIYRVQPVPSFILSDEPLELPEITGQRWVENAAIYDSDDLFPAHPVEMDPPEQLRSQRVVRLRFYPFQYRPASGQLLRTRTLRVEIVFSPTGVSNSSRQGRMVNEGAFEEILRKAILNYSSAQAWRTRGPAPESASLLWMYDDEPDFKVGVVEDGVYRLGYQDLQAAGMDLGAVDPATLRMYDQGVEMAIWVSGEADGTFDPGDFIEFYGQKRRSKYGDENIYWLTYGTESGRRMGTKDGTPGSFPIPGYYPTTERAAEDHWYVLQFAEGDDHWFWDYILASTSVVTKTFAIELDNIATMPHTATARIFLHGVTDMPISPDHHARLSLNDHAIGNLIWDGVSPAILAVDIPSSYLVEGTNALKVGLPNDLGATYDMIYLGSIEIGYRKTFVAQEDKFAFEFLDPGQWQFQVTGLTTDTFEILDVTQPLTASLVLNAAALGSAGSYTVTFQDELPSPAEYTIVATPQIQTPPHIEKDIPSNLKDPANRADYILITYSGFYTDVLPLADYRAGQGLATAMVRVEDVYDEFGYGMLSAEAIRDFLAYAYAAWTEPAPSHVLLVGDGHYDFRNILSSGTGNYIPPFLASVDPWLNETAADNCYVAPSCGMEASFPFMVIGRFPVNSTAETSAMVQKTIDYELSPPAGGWNQQVLFVADDADEAGDFAAISEDLIDACLPAPYTPERVYYGVNYNDAGLARTAIVNAINSGQLLVNYIGHGSIQLWASPRLFGLTEVALLTNTEKWPVMLPMTCYEGLYQSPTTTSVAETVVRQAGKGSIANWSPAGLGVAMGHDYLNRGFFDAVFRDGVRSLGMATMAGKLRLWSVGIHLDLINTYNLFGDPALHINALDTDLQVAKTVEPEGQLEPGDVLTYTIAFTNAGPAMAHGVLLTDVLPAELVAPVVVDTSLLITQTSGITFAWTITPLLPGESGWLQIRAEVGPLTQSHTLINQAEIASRTPDTDPLNNVATAESDLYLPNADLQIDKTVQPAGQVSPSAVLTYTLAFTNAGPDPAYSVCLTDVLPAVLVSPTIVYASPEVISQHIGITYAWTIADLQPGDAGLIQVRAVVSPAAEPGFVIVNQAHIAAATADLSPENNTSSVTTGVQVPDLSVDKAGPASVLPGETITYTITWANVGLAPAYGVRLTDTLPAGVSYVADSSGWTHSEPAPGTIVWQVTPDPLPPSPSATFVVTGWVGMDANLTGPLVNQVHIHSEQPDGNPDNDSSEWSTALLLPELGIVKTGPAEVTELELISYTLAYSNAGDAPAVSAVITDVLPPGVTYVGDDSGLVHSEPWPGTHTWQVGPSLSPGGGGTFTLVAQVGTVNETGTIITNQVTIGAISSDPLPGNNASQWVTRVAARSLRIYLPLVVKQ